MPQTHHSPKTPCLPRHDRTQPQLCHPERSSSRFHRELRSRRTPARLALPRPPPPSPPRNSYAHSCRKHLHFRQSFRNGGICIPNFLDATSTLQMCKMFKTMGSGGNKMQQRLMKQKFGVVRKVCWFPVVFQGGPILRWSYLATISALSRVAPLLTVMLRVQS
jgi:hypothetical protein